MRNAVTQEFGPVPDTARYYKVRPALFGENSVGSRSPEGQGRESGGGMPGENCSPSTQETLPWSQESQHMFDPRPERLKETK